MKKIIVILFLSTSVLFSYGQKSVDALFSKYSGKEGFTTVSLRGELLKATCILNEKNEERYPSADINEIRILVQDDEDIIVENFYEKVLEDINLNDYEEYMHVKKKGNDLRMLVRSGGSSFREFLLIGGGEDNLVVQIKGNLTYRDAKRLSEDLKKDNGLEIAINPNK